MRLTTAFVLLFLCFSFHAPAQQVHTPEKPVAEKDRPASDAHSFQELFQTLERNWIEAVQRRDSDAVDALLAPEFMSWTSEDPENPTPRAEWVQHAFAHVESGTLTPGAMSIRAFVGSALVSFQLTHTDVIDGKQQTQRYFIIDLWEVNHGRWQVADRYVTHAGKPPCSNN